MKEDRLSENVEREEDPRIELYRTALQDVRYILETYGAQHPAEAWETIRKIVYNKKLKISNH